MPSLIADPGSVEEIGRAVARRQIKPDGLVETCLRRIDTVEQSVQGWCVLDRERALARGRMLRQEAEAGRLRGPLHGVPIAIKDVVDVAGLPTRAGSPTRTDIAPSTSDAQVVAQLRAAGAVILGKAHTTEFAHFGGVPPTRNPHNLAHTPGGSSAGPAALVAAGMVPLSIGTQTAGSVSRPAAYCGIAAFKPSTRAWSSFGVVALAPSFDTVGIFGYRVRDAVTAARVLTPPYLRGRPQSGPSRTIGFIEDPILAAASTEVAQTRDDAFKALAGADISVERWPSPAPLAAVMEWHKIILDYEMARVHADLEHRHEVNAGLREAIARGRSLDETAYHQARLALDAARDQFVAATARFAGLIFPAAPDVAPAGTSTGDPRFIVPFTALGGPIVSIPVAFGAGKLPLGLMLLGAPGTDEAIAETACRIADIIELPR